MRAKDAMSDGVTSIAHDATVQEAVELLVNTGVSAMPVLDADGFMIGIVSEADLIRKANQKAWQRDELDEQAIGADLARPVTEVMTRSVITVDESLPLGEVAKQMATQRVKRLPVTRGKSVVGIVSRVDLLKALLSRRRSGSAFARKEDAPPFSGGELLRDAVISALRGHSWSVARRSDVVVSDGVVHLWGTVPNRIVLDAYRDAAAQVPGVKSVEVHMHILPGA